MSTITPAATFPDSGAGGFSTNAVATPYSGTFIPTIWSGKILEKFYAATVIAAIANTDYEGEISSYGDKVIIRQRPTLTINSYSADANLSFERPSETTVELAIDKGEYFAAIVDDVYEVQSDLNLLDLWADDAGEQMKITIDTNILAGISGLAHASNVGATAGAISGNINLGVSGTPRAVTQSNVVDLIVEMGQVLDEQNVPENNRWLVLPAWMCAKIKRSDLRDASLTGDSVSISRNGRIGMIDRFTIYMSNLLPSSGSGATAEYSIYAGHPTAITFASQLTKVETIRSEKTFGTILRGLQVYGYNVVKPESLVEAVVQAA